LVQKDACLTEAKVQEAIDELRGAVTIVYPMGLPPHDPIQMEFENKEDLEGTQVIDSIYLFLLFYCKIYHFLFKFFIKAALEVIPFQDASIWFSGKEMIQGKKLMDYLGKNEKSKVIVKIQKVFFSNSTYF
jgi:hypothetical protein